jgi:chromosome segregation ATPase
MARCCSVRRASGRELAQLAERVRWHAEQLHRAEEAAADRDEIEQAAAESWSAWHATASELAAQHAAVDLSLEQARAKLAETQAARETTERDLKATQKAGAALGPRLGKAEADRDQAGRDASEQTARLAAAAQRFNRSLALPGLAAAASAEPLSGVVYVAVHEELTVDMLLSDLR